jgi:OPT family oligopeptide transporter
MTLPTLSDEQVQRLTRAEKDRWWLDNVFKGDMPQLTLRSATTGFVLGGLLSATNLYVGAKTGWTLGVGLTSVILAFAMFKAFARLGASDMSLLENNAMQSVATAAGYMTAPLVSGLAAFMWIEDRTLPWWQIMTFNVVLSLMGVLVAFPMKRRFINDEQQPFPEGRAAGVVLHTLYSSSAAVGLFKARALAAAAAGAGLLKALSSESIMKLVQERLLGLKTTIHLPEHLDAAWYWAAAKGWLPQPRLPGIADVRPLGLSPTLDLAMFGAGGLMGTRTALGMFAGMVVNYLIVVPWMVVAGEIQPKTIVDGVAQFPRSHVLNTWALWWGVAIMVVASLVGLLAKPQIFVAAFQTLTSKKSNGDNDIDVLKDIELPLWVSALGIPVIGAVSVWMAHAWFGVDILLGVTAIPLILVLTLIAASSTAMTGITPTGSLSKIPQFLYGALRPQHPATNLMTAVMCIEVASNASNLLMDIKPGYMLGARPRQQAIGHAIGVVAGTLFATPLFFLLFLSDRRPGQSVQDAMTSGPFSFPSAVQWKGISDLIQKGFTSLPASVQTSMVIAAVVAVVFEVARVKTKGRFPLSPLAIGLGVVIPPESTIAMTAGALFFDYMHRRHAPAPSSTGANATPVGVPAHDPGTAPSDATPARSMAHALWVETREPICAGLVAGAALVGILDVLVRVFLLG